MPPSSAIRRLTIGLRLQRPFVIWCYPKPGREAAQQLGLCTATVYGLCAEGALPHIRILNAIRIASADLATFVVERRIDSRR